MVELIAARDGGDNDDDNDDNDDDNGDDNDNKWSRRRYQNTIIEENN